MEDSIRELDKYLPRSLRQFDTSESRTLVAADPNFTDVLSILLHGRGMSDRNVLAFMVLRQHRYKAGICLAEVLLKRIALAANQPFKNELPSNIDWPAGSFSRRARAPVELDRTLHLSRRPLGSSLQCIYDGSHDGDNDTAMEIIWSFLADLVIASTKRPADEGKRIMNTVHQVLALIHRLGLVPASIYAHCPPRGTTTIQQPPFLHLLNSKILSTLSDVVWHVYQKEESARSGKGEKSPWTFFPQPPGSPLRSKGRELGPEVWMEFILWCCVEEGFASTGSRILKSLRGDVNHPWQAVPWPDPGLPPTEWDRISPGGEWLEKDSQQKIISAEVVLAIIDGLITNLDSEVISDDFSVRRVQDEIKDLLSFMEPQDSTPTYLDYLGVRLLQTERLYGADKAMSVCSWASTLMQLRDPHSDQQTRHESGLPFDFVLDRSELPAGILHQGVQACIESNLPKEAVDTFTDIQKMVDGNKLQSIGEFLSLPLSPDEGFFTSRLGRGQHEFLNSHGQLPIYKLVPLLDMVSTAKLFGLGDWLLFSDDIDGPVLPEATWGQPSVAAVVARYAAAKRDPVLLDRVFSICTASDRKMTVNVLRAFASCYFDMSMWDKVSQLLQQLQRAEGGGYSPMMIASIAATILRLEVDPQVLLHEDSQSDLSQAMLLFSTILSGSYDSSGASFRITQKKIFRVQVGYLLRLIENVAESKLAAMATHYKPRFLTGNEAHLARNTFNTVYAAIVETKGALEGRKLWHLFCTDPRDPGALVEGQLDDEIMPVEHAAKYDDDDYIQPERGARSGEQEEPSLGPDQDVSNAGTEHDSLESPAEAQSDGILGNFHAHSASLGVQAVSPSDHYNSVINQPVEMSDMEGDNSEIPIETLDADSGEGTADLTPMVVPDARTLEILLKRALSEISARKWDRRPYDDLEELIRWSVQFYKALNFQRSSSLPRALKGPSRERRRRPKHVRRAQEKVKPDVSGQFTGGAFITRLPGEQRAQEHATEIFGDHEPDDGRSHFQRTGRALQPTPRFKVRKV